MFPCWISHKNKTKYRLKLNTETLYNNIKHNCILFHFPWFYTVHNLSSTRGCYEFLQSLIGNFYFLLKLDTLLCFLIQNRLLTIFVFFFIVNSVCGFLVCLFIFRLWRKRLWSVLHPLVLVLFHFSPSALFAFLCFLLTFLFFRSCYC